MGFDLVASGGYFDLAGLDKYESQIEEGARGLLELDLRMDITAGIAQELEDQLRAAGVTNANVTTASQKVRIYFKKGFPWLAVIAAIALGLIFLAILIIGWRLYQDVSGIIPPPIPQLALLAVIAVVAVLAINVTRRKGP